MSESSALRKRGEKRIVTYLSIVDFKMAIGGQTVIVLVFWVFVGRQLFLRRGKPCMVGWIGLRSVPVTRALGNMWAKSMAQMPVPVKKVLAVREYGNKKVPRQRWTDPFRCQARFEGCPRWAPSIDVPQPSVGTRRVEGQVSPVRAVLFHQ